MDDGDRAFVEHPVDESRQLSFSSLMTAEACARLDATAYRAARQWYLADGADSTEVAAVSLGRAFEYTATALLVRHLRAAFVLERLVGEARPRRLVLREVGEEWRAAAAALGLDVDMTSVAASRSMPGGRPPGPSRLERALGVAVAAASRRRPRLALLGTPRWAEEYQRAMLRLGPALLVNPGARTLVRCLTRLRPERVTWLADAPAGRGPALAGEPGDLGDPRSVLLGPFSELTPALAGWAHAGQLAGTEGFVAVADQDVLPAARAMLLGIQSSGGRVVALEHGMAGHYSSQVWSVADVLAVWGPEQAAYHQIAGPPRIRTAVLGWPRLEAAVRAASPGSPSWDVVHFAQPSDFLSAGDWPEDHARPIRLVDEYAAAHPERRVAIKLHPATAAYTDTVPPIEHATLVSGESLELIRQSRIVVVTRSTTGLEAMALGRPVVQVASLGYLGPADFIAASGAATGVSSAEELEAAVEALLGHESRRAAAIEAGHRYARRFVAGLDEPGSAVERLLALVRTLEAAHPAVADE